ncbi:MAG TPA: hypothetical protein V6D47_14560, partial [Oscillatoriaceae cyanobacterium]
DTYLILLANGAPAGFSAVARGGSIAFAWNAVGTATSYNLKRSTAVNGPFTTFASGITTTSYTDTSAGNGGYYYVVSAENGSSEGPNSAAVAPTVIVDDADAAGVAISGTWYSSTNATGYFGTDYLYANGGGQSVRFTPTLLAANYAVFARWTANANRDANVPIDVTSAAGTSTSYVNQQANGGTWAPLGSFGFNAGTAGNALVRTDGTTGFVVADAIEFVPVLVATPSGLAAAGGDGQVTLSWNPVANATGYNVKRGTSASGPFTVIGSNVANPAYVDSGLTDGTTYYYVVSALGTTGESPNSTTVSATPRTPAVIMDNADASGVAISGSWTAGTGVSGYYGTNYLSAGTVAQSGTCRVTFTPNLATAGTYAVYARWTAAANRATQAPIDVNYAGGTFTASENEQVNNGNWILVGTASFNAGTGGSIAVYNTGANGYVVADAVELVQQ